LPARQRAGLGEQRKDSLLSEEVIHPREEAYRAEEPSYRVAGAARGDDDSDRRAGYGYHYALDPEVEYVWVGIGEVPNQE
jgi:hypothetical protein